MKGNPVARSLSIVYCINTLGAHRYRSCRFVRTFPIFPTKHHLPVRPVLNGVANMNCIRIYTYIVYLIYICIHLFMYTALHYTPLRP